MTRLLPGVIAMAIIVVVSNILVQFPYGDYLTWGAFTYPFAFLVGDLVNRLQGARAARTVVFAGFLAGLFCSVIGTQIEGAFGPLVTLRVALASGLGYLASQLIDVALFQRLRHKSWWVAPMISSAVASTLDAMIFFTIAFSAMFTFVEPYVDVTWAHEPMAILGVGPTAPFWVSLAIGDWCVKITLAMIALVPFRIIIARLGQKLA